MIPTIWFMLVHILDYCYTVGSKMWPEFEIIIEDESEYNKDMSEGNSLAVMPTQWPDSDDINSLSKDFQVLTCFH